MDLIKNKQIIKLTNQKKQIISEKTDSKKYNFNLQINKINLLTKKIYFKIIIQNH